MVFCYNIENYFLAMNLKSIPYEIKPISLIKNGGEQHSIEFREMNPMEQLPALSIDGNTYIESVQFLLPSQDFKLYYLLPI